MSQRDIIKIGWVRLVGGSVAITISTTLHCLNKQGAIHRVRTQHGGGVVSPKYVQMRAGGGGSLTQ